MENTRMDDELKKLLDSYEELIAGGYFVEAKTKARQKISDYMNSKYEDTEKLKAAYKIAERQIEELIRK
jgi:hypothetical protein